MTTARACGMLKPVNKLDQTCNIKTMLGVLFSLLMKKRILTWSYDGNVRLWDVPGDLDFPSEKYILQTQALTGTRFDPVLRQITVIPVEEWRALQKEYLEFAQEHAQACEYLRQNVYLRFWGKVDRKE